MPQVSVTGKSRTLANGTANDAVPVEQNFVELYNNDTALASGVNTIIGTDSVKGAIDGRYIKVRNSFTGAPTTETCGLEVTRGTSPSVQLQWNETNTRWESTTDGTNFFPMFSSLANDPGTPVEGQLWYNSTAKQIKARTNAATVTLVDTGSIPWPTLFNATAAPLYLTANTFSVARIACRNNADNGNIIKATSTTVDKTTTGLNGIAQSANLTGTISVTASGTTVSGTSTTFATDFVVGDVIRTNGGQARRITAVTNNTTMTVTPAWTSSETTVAYRNGGDAPSTFYNLYAITDGTTPGLILSTRNVAGGQTLVNLPTGYTSSRQLPFCTTNNASSNIIPFRVGAGWPSRPKILYNVQMSMFDGSVYTAGTTNVLNAGTAGTFTAISLSAFQPPISTVSLIATYAQGANAGQWNVRPTGETHLGMPVAEDAVQTAALNPSIFLTYQQSLDYRRAFGSGSLYIDVFGFVVTEVA